MKKTLTKSVFSLLLAAAMLMVSLCGCGGGTGTQEPVDNQTESTVSAGSLDEVVDLQGYEFVISSGFIQDEPDMETIMGSERSFEEARRQVEQEYNCKITIKYFEPTVENIREKVVAGDKIADVMHIPMNLLLQSIRAGYIQSLDNVNGLDLTDSRWVEVCTDMASYDGVHYGLNFMRPSEVRNCIIYNREILREFGITEDLEQLVLDKQWTFDKLEELAKQCTQDTDGDGQINVWGLASAVHHELGMAMINANGGNLITVEDGVAKESFDSQEVVTALNYLSKWANETKILANGYNSGATLSGTTQGYAEYFVGGNCAFLHCESWLDSQYIKKVAGDLDFGMLPVPMGPDATDYTSTAYSAQVFAVPITNKDMDKTVIIMNALAKAVLGDGGDTQEAMDYDIMMDYFQKGDTKGVEMYKLILSKSYVDLGAGIESMLTEFKEVCIGDACYRNIGTPAAAIEALSGTFQSVIDGVYNNK